MVWVRWSVVGWQVVPAAILAWGMGLLLLLPVVRWAQFLCWRALQVLVMAPLHVRRRGAVGHLLGVTPSSSSAGWPVQPPQPLLSVHVLQRVVLRVALLRVHEARGVRVRVALQVVGRQPASAHGMLRLWMLPPERLLLVVCVGWQRVAR